MTSAGTLQWWDCAALKVPLPWCFGSWDDGSLPTAQCCERVALLMLDSCRGLSQSS